MLLAFCLALTALLVLLPMCVCWWVFAQYHRERAALMHDIGQLSLVDPVPAGATAVLPEAEQRRIALLGGAVVRQTGVAAAVALVVERQADRSWRLRPATAGDYAPDVVEALARVLARDCLTAPATG